MPPLLAFTVPLLLVRSSSATWADDAHSQLQEAEHPQLVRHQPSSHDALESPSLLQIFRHGSREKAKLSIVYGVMTNGLPDYREKLAAQVETWAAGLTEQGRFFAVSGAGSPRSEAAGVIVEEGCQDSKAGLPCKEVKLLEEGYRRDPDWFVILGEDNYVNLPKFEEELHRLSANLSSEVPTVLGILGCGMGLGFCPEVDELGGLCGGGTYAVNRATLKALMAEGQDALEQEYTAKIVPGDMASACAFRRRGVKFIAMGGLMGNRILTETEFSLVLERRPLTLHYVTANVMHWVHAKLQKQPESEVDTWKAAAFDGGCCCAWQESDLEECKAEVRSSASTLQMEGAGVARDWSDLTREYIKERDWLLAHDK